MKNSEQLIKEFIENERNNNFNLERETWLKLNDVFPAGPGRAKMRGKLFNKIRQEIFNSLPTNNIIRIKK